MSGAAASTGDLPDGTGRPARPGASGASGATSRGATARSTTPGPAARPPLRTTRTPTARAAARPSRPGLRAPERPGAAPRRTGSLRLVTPRTPRVGRGAFLGLVVGLLVLGLLGLLALNTTMAQDSFHLHALQVEAKQLTDREQVLQSQVDAMQAPGQIATRAQQQGMVPGGPPAFLRMPDGAVLGDPAPATSPPAPPSPTPSAAAADPSTAPQAAAPAADQAAVAAAGDVAGPAADATPTASTAPTPTAAPTPKAATSKAASSKAPTSKAPTPTASARPRHTTAPSAGAPTPRSTR